MNAPTPVLDLDVPPGSIASFERQPVEVSQLLPFIARRTLVGASRIEGENPISVRRTAAIDRATAAAKFNHPQFFKEQ
jgi:hypothetical protein